MDKPKIKTLTTHHHVLPLTGKQLIEMLRLDAKMTVEVPADATVSFRVPSGGDWSGTEIEIDGDNPVQISWTIKYEE
jgi:hypothetical protein